MAPDSRSLKQANSEEKAALRVSFEGIRFQRRLIVLTTSQDLISQIQDRIVVTLNITVHGKPMSVFRCTFCSDQTADLMGKVEQASEHLGVSSETITQTLTAFYHSLVVHT